MGSWKGCDEALGVGLFDRLIHEQASPNLYKRWQVSNFRSGDHRAPTDPLTRSYFFVIAGSSIKIHSSATGKVVSTLSVSPVDSNVADSRSDTITSAILNPNNAFQLITGSLGGLIRIWDFLDGIILQTISIEDPIFYLCAHVNFPDHVFVAAAKPTKRKGGKGTSIMYKATASLTDLQAVRRIPTAWFYMSLSSLEPPLPVPRSSHHLRWHSLGRRDMWLGCLYLPVALG